MHKFCACFSLNLDYMAKINITNAKNEKLQQYKKKVKKKQKNKKRAKMRKIQNKHKICAQVRKFEIP